MWSSNLTFAYFDAWSVFMSRVCSSRVYNLRLGNAVNITTRYNLGTRVYVYVCVSEMQIISVHNALSVLDCMYTSASGECSK